MKGAPLKANRAESKRLSVIIGAKECRPNRRARIIAVARVPLDLHQGVSPRGVHPLQTVKSMKERRNSPVHNAVDMDRTLCGIQRLCKGCKVRLAGGVEWHRDVTITDSGLRQPLSRSGQGFGMLVQRQIDDEAHPDRGKPGRV